MTYQSIQEALGVHKIKELRSSSSKKEKKSWEVFGASIFCWKIKQYEKKKKKLIIFCIRTPSLFPWACVYLIIIIIINPLGFSSEKSNPSEFQLV